MVGLKKVSTDELIAQADILGVSASSLLWSVALLCGIEKVSRIHAERFCESE